MKFDKETIIMLALCALVLFGWPYFSEYMGWSSKPQQPATVQQNNAVNENKPPVNSVPSVVVGNKSSENTTAKIVELANVVMENDQVKVEFAPNYGLIKSIELKNYQLANREGNILLDNNHGLTIPLHEGALALIFSGVPAVEEVILNQVNGNVFTLERRLLLSGFEILARQEWTLEENYTISYKVTLSNPSGQNITLPGFGVDGGDMQGWNLLSGDNQRSETHTVSYFSTNGDFVSDDISDGELKNKGLAVWEAISNKYFTTVLRSDKPFEFGFKRQLIDDKNYLAFVTANYSNIEIPSNGTVDLSFKYYAGPKIIADLKAFDDSATRLVHLSWGPIDYLARFLLMLLVFFKSICHSYGWSIIILTVIVRIIFWPVTQKANVSMKKMQLVQPKVQAIRDQYPDKEQAAQMNAKIMELYRTEGVNPLGGCLPILLQIPVFFALYAALDGAVELRHVPFWWSSDLAGPDTIGRIFGLPINPLAITMTALMVLQQLMTPSTMPKAQQRMMLLMPVVMLFVLYNLPSGLTLYWTVSQIFSILQLVVQNKLGAGAAKPSTVASK